ncbi:MAG TPA: radical SAM protein, partial [Acidovorax sp.]
MKNDPDPADPPCDPPPEARIPIHAIRGRGAATTMPHRFMHETRTVVDDGWDFAPDGEGHAALPPTRVHLETARSALCANDSPDIFFEHSVNPYRGCEHGCVYCYARPTHSYLNLSPGLDFETQIIAKHNIAEVLRAELARPGHVPRLLNIGSATDCYQPVERELRLTRGVIEVLRDARHPFSLISKSSGVERDLDLLAPLAAQRLVAVYVTITTLDA